jgi:hypothetical protein
MPPNGGPANNSLGKAVSTPKQKTKDGFDKPATPKKRKPEKGPDYPVKKQHVATTPSPGYFGQFPAPADLVGSDRAPFLQSLTSLHGPSAMPTQPSYPSFIHSMNSHVLPSQQNSPYQSTLQPSGYAAPPHMGLGMPPSSYSPWTRGPMGHRVQEYPSQYVYLEEYYDEGPPQPQEPAEEAPRPSEAGDELSKPAKSNMS